MFEKGEKVALKENLLITGTVILVKRGMAFHSYRVLWFNGQELEHPHKDLERVDD